MPAIPVHFCTFGTWSRSFHFSRSFQNSSPAREELVVFTHGNFSGTMTAAHRIGHAAYKGPSVVKELLMGFTFGLMAGGLWKMHHWNNKRRTKEFYDMLEKGEISVVVEE